MAGLPAKARLTAAWSSPGDSLPFEVQFNPTELQFEKSAQIAEIVIPGLEAPLQQFVRGQAEKLTVELFFDTTESGTGLGARSVTELTDRIFQLLRIDEKLHAPPVVTFEWKNLPGGHVVPVHQRRSGFVGVAESVRQKFMLFSPEGVPLRAMVTLTLREYLTLDQQLDRLKLSSPDRTHSHVLAAGETLASVAAGEWKQPAQWRAIADANGIEDPRRIDPGTMLVLPVLRG